MTPEQLIEVYKLAYKKAFDWPWKKQALPKPPNPTLVPSPAVAPAGLSRLQNSHPFDQRDRYDIPKTPTWTDPEDFHQVEDLNEIHMGRYGLTGYPDRKSAQYESTKALNNYLRHGVSPQVQDSYNPSNGYFNMSREAMLRRINMLTRQQARDKKIRAAAGFTE